MKRSDQIRADNRRGALILLGCCGAVAAVGSGLWVTKPAAREKDTQCKAGRAKQHTLVIVDASDGFGKAQVATLQAALTRLAADLPEDDRLSLFVFDGIGRTSAPIASFERCKTDDGSNSSSLISNVSHIKKAHLAHWHAPFANVLAALPNATGNKQTELVRFVADVAGLVPYAQKSERTQLKLFSNLEENGEVSFYDKKQVLSATDFVSYFKRVMKDRLHGMAVDITYLPAPKTTTDLTRRTKAAWSQALSASGITFSIKDL